jgi:excisionase family DNA binding protein
MLMAERPEIITATIETFGEMSGLSRRTIYRLIESGAIRSVKIGTRRLVVIESYREYLTHNSTHESECAAEARRDVPRRSKPAISLVRDG